MKPAERLFRFQCLLQDHLFGGTDPGILAGRLIQFLADRAYQWDYGSIPTLSGNLEQLLPSVLRGDFVAFDTVRRVPATIKESEEPTANEGWAEFAISYAADMAWQYEFRPALEGSLELSPEGWLISSFGITLGTLSSLSWQVGHPYALFLLNCRRRDLHPDIRRGLAEILPDVLAEISASGLATATLWVVLLARTIDEPIHAQELFAYALKFRADTIS